MYAINVMYCPTSTFKTIVDLFNEEVLDYKVNKTNVTFYVNNIYHVNEIVEQLDSAKVLNSNNMTNSENKITIYKTSSSRINDNLNVNDNICRQTCIKKYPTRTIKSIFITSRLRV